MRKSTGALAQLPCTRRVLGLHLAATSPNNLAAHSLRICGRFCTQSLQITPSRLLLPWQALHSVAANHPQQATASPVNCK